MIENFTTNRILRHSRGGKEFIFYLPAYFRLNLKNIIAIELENLQGTINCTLLLTINYKGLPSEYFDTLKESVNITFSKDTPIHLTPSVQCQVRDNKKDYTLNFIVRKSITLAMNPLIFWSPFQYIQLILNATVQPIRFKQNNKNIYIKFNLMDCKDNLLKISCSEDCSFGYYALADAKMKAVYNRSAEADQLKVKNQNTHTLVSSLKLEFAYDKLQSKQPQKFETFHYAHFTIPVYKHPMATLCTIFFPIWMLSCLNLAIFFQQNTLGSRFLNIAALMISYVALIPSIRQAIPPSKHIVFIQFLIYLQSSLTLICLFQSVLERNNDMIDDIYTQNWRKRPFLIISILITIFTITSVLLLSFLHKFMWKSSYHLKQPPVNLKFDHQTWRNEECDEYFANRMLKNRSTSLLQIQ